MNISYIEEELSEVAEQLISQFSKVDVWVFEGEMGAGKTTLIKEICSQLGVEDGMSSPTFSIINEYLTRDAKDIYHFDCYRMKNLEEALNIGMEDYFFSGNKCMVEWPSVITSLLPDDYLEISIKLVDRKTRNLITTLNGPTL